VRESGRQRRKARRSSSLNRGISIWQTMPTCSSR